MNLYVGDDGLIYGWYSSPMMGQQKPATRIDGESVPSQINNRENYPMEVKLKAARPITACPRRRFNRRCGRQRAEAEVQTTAVQRRPIGRDKKCKGSILRKRPLENTGKPPLDQMDTVQGVTSNRLFTFSLLG